MTKPETPTRIACLSILVLVGATTALAYGTRRNLCHNGTFDHEEGPLHGWTADYQWQGNSHYMQNHTRVSVLPQYQGKRNVLFINGSSETKVESRPIPFEPGARYRCTLEMRSDTSPHIYFTGYKWKPGIRPYETPHIGDLRRIYKGQFRNHDVKNIGGGWKRVSFEFPLENLSKLAMKHLRHVRFITVHMIVLADFTGKLYVDNVEVVRIK